MSYGKTDKQIEQEMINKFFDDIWAKKVKVVEELIKSNQYKTEGKIILCCYIGAISYERYVMSNPDIRDGDAYKKMLLNYSGLDLYQKIDLLFFYKWPVSEYNSHKSYNYFWKNNYENYRKIKQIIEKKFGSEEKINSKNRFIAKKEVLDMIDAANIRNIKINEINFLISDW